MPVYVLSILVQVGLVVHVIKTGRNTIWIWVLVLLPLAGPLAYIAVELLPELLGGRTARRTVSTVKRTLDPNRELREAHKQLRIDGSIDSRRRYADALFGAAQYPEAAEQYRLALTGLYTHDPQLLFGLARTQFALNEPAQARATLDLLIKENPNFKSAEGHLLYARALDGEGDTARARQEYETLVKYYPGAEAKYRYAILLRGAGDARAADEVLRELASSAELAAKHYRKEQKEWIDLARQELRGKQ